MAAPVLPAELEREICDLVIFGTSDSRTAYNIIRVARRFREWFQPELYRIIRCTRDGIVFPPIYITPPPPTKLYTAVSLPLDIAFLKKCGTHVRHIIIYQRPIDEVKIILSHCSNVENLALLLPYGCLHGNGLINAIDELTNLKRLSVSLCDLFPDPGVEGYASPGSVHLVPFYRPSFLGLTHLEIFCIDVNGQADWDRIKQLATLPSLTHVWVGTDVSAPALLAILRECKAVQVVVLVTSHPGYCSMSEGEKLNQDKRFVHFRTGGSANDWEGDVRGLDTYWREADCVVHSRRRQEISSNNDKYELE